MKLCCKEFERVVSEQPQATAIIDGSKKYSYLQLNELANQIAHMLNSCQLDDEAVIGVYCQPKVTLVASIIAIWKVGKSYCGIPVSADVPFERLKSYVDEAKPNVMLVDDTTRDLELLDHLGSHTTQFDLSDNQALSRYQTTNLDVEYDLNRRAYIIFTSGSTGKPKGVVIEHTGLKNCFTENIRILKLNKRDKVAQFAQVAFDAHLMEIFIALLSGAALVMVPNHLKKSPHELAELYKSTKVSVSIFTPSMLKVLDPKNLPHIRVVTSTGEKIDRATLSKWLLDWIKFTDGYGPSEVTICTSVGQIADQNTVNCGVPIKGLRVWVMTDDGEAKVGEEGEFYISGEGLAREYLNNPELTTKRFVNLQTREGVLRAFKANDLGYLDESGCIHITGRKDRQIKIHGKLFHPAETEAMLQMHPQVKSAYVEATINDAGNAVISAFIHSAQEKLTNDQIRNVYQFIKTKLPHYMLPNGWVFVERQVSMSAKFDWKKVISQAHKINRIMHPLCESPRDELERKLLELWQQELGVVSEHDSIHDDFFHRGSSIQCALFINAVNSLQRTTGVNISLTEFVAEPTIAALARIIRVKNNTVKLNPLVRLNDSDATSEQEKIPLFLVHSILGDAESDYRVFANLIRNSITLFGLQCVGLTDEYNFPCSIEGIARIYVQAIKAVHSKGPYIILGWSAGGLIGYEMVHQLNSAGEEAYLLAVDIEYFTFWQGSDNKAHAKRLIELVEGSILPIIKLQNFQFEAQELAEHSKAEQVVQLFGRLQGCTREKNDLQKLSAIRNMLLSILSYDFRKKIAPVSLFTTEKTEQKCGDSNLGWPVEVISSRYHQKEVGHFVMVDEQGCNALVSDIKSVHRLIELKSRMRAEVGTITWHYVQSFQGIKDEFVELMLKGVDPNFTLNFTTNPVRLFMQGTAFVGASTLVKSLCYQWARGQRWNNQIDLLLCFDLMQQQVDDDAKHLDLATLINKYCTTQIFQKTTTRFVNAAKFVSEQPHKVMIIVDNIHHANQNSNVFQLLLKVIANPAINVMLVGRKDNINELNSRMTVQVLGFSKPAVYEFVKKYFRFDRRVAAKVMYLLSVHDDLVTLLRNPYYCRLFCSNIRELLSYIDDDEFIGLSKTVIMRQLMDKLWVKYLFNTLKVLYAPRSVEIASGFQRLRSSMETFLQIIAFSSLEHQQQTIPSKVVNEALKQAFRKDQELNFLLNNIISSGLIHEVRQGIVQELAFQAPLLKHWFAACYWVRYVTSSEQADYQIAVQKIRSFYHDPEFFQVWILVVGILREKQADFNPYHFLQLLFEKVNAVQDIASEQYYHFMRKCLQEAGLMKTVVEASSEFDSEQKRLQLFEKLSVARQVEKRVEPTKPATVFFQISHNAGVKSLPIQAKIIGCKIHLPYFYKTRLDYHKIITKNFKREHNANIYKILHGSSGMGKSTLALDYANSKFNQYPGGIYWLDATNVSTLENSWREIAVSFGISAELSINNLILKLQPILNKLKRSLFIVDNVNNRKEIEHLLLFEQKSMQAFHDILVTTENQPTKSWGEHYALKLGLLDHNFSKDIIREILQHFGVDVTDTEADRLATTLCDWPFFIVQSAYTIKSAMKVEDYIHSLVDDDESKYVEKLLLEQNSLPSSLQYIKSAMDAHLLTCRSVESVSTGATSLLKLLAFFSDSNIPMAMFANYKNFYPLVKVLVDFHLVEINMQVSTISILSMRKRLILQQIRDSGDFTKYLLQAVDLLLNSHELTGRLLLDQTDSRLYLLNATNLIMVFDNELKSFPDVHSKLAVQVVYYLTYGVGDYKLVLKNFKNFNFQLDNALLSMTLHNCFAYCFTYDGNISKSIDQIILAAGLYAKVKQELIELPDLFIEQSLRMCMIMASLFRIKNAFPRALELYRFFSEQIEVEQYFSHTAVDFVINYGFNLAISEEFDRANAFYKQAKVMIKSAKGNKLHSKLTLLLNCKADLQLEGYKDAKKALPMFKELERQYCEMYNEQHNHLAVVARCLGDCHLLLDEPVIAREQYERSLKIHKQNGFKAPGLLQKIYLSLVKACQKQGDLEAVKEYQAQIEGTSEEKMKPTQDEQLNKLEFTLLELILPKELHSDQNTSNCCLQ